MGDWYPTRAEGNAEKKWDKYLKDRAGKSQFTIKMGIGVLEKSDPTRHSINFGNLWLGSFGASKGRELTSFGDWTKGSVESIIRIISMEKSPRAITWTWENDGRKNFFGALKGKKLDLDFDISVSTAGSITALHYTLKLQDCHIVSVGHEYHKLDKTSVKFERINAKCGSVEFEAAQ